MAKHYKFMTTQYLLCSPLPAVSNGQISLISPGAVTFFGFVFFFLLPSACVTTTDHAIVVPSKNTHVLIPTKFQGLLPRTCVCQEVNKHKI